MAKPQPLAITQQLPRVADHIAKWRACTRYLWVLNTIEHVYKLHFTRTPLAFMGVKFTTVSTTVNKLAMKQSLLPVLPDQWEAGTYRHYFLVPKKTGSLRPTLDLLPLNGYLFKIPSVQQGDWMDTIDL